jgi:hypothetical protein
VAGLARFTAGLLLLGAVGLLGAPSVEARPHYGKVVLSDDKKTDKSVFKPDTAALYVVATLVDVPEGTVVKAVWIAEKTQVAPPNFVIDKAEMKGGGSYDQATFNLSKPNAGWPLGDYRVELYIADKLAQTLHFQIKP